MQGLFEYAFGDEFEELEATVMKKLQVDRGIQNIFTPIKDIEKTTNFKFSSVLNNDTKTVGILFNTEFVRYILKSFDEDYLNNISITFFYDSQFDKKEVERIKVEYQYKKDIELISIEDFNENNKDIKVIMNAMKNKKFDIVFSNPPYNNNLDLKILQELFKVSEKIVFIHPSTWALDKKFQTNIYNNIRNTNYLNSIYFLSNGNELFNIKNNVPICITIWNMNKQNDNVNVFDQYFSNTNYVCKINDIDKYGNYNNIITEFKKSIKEYINIHQKSLYEHRIKKDYSDLTNYSIKFALIRGHINLTKAKYQDDFFTMLALNFNDNLIDNTFRYQSNPTEKEMGYARYLVWSFNNENERKNFINYCKTKITRFCLSLLKIGSALNHGEISLIPWMDFSRSWNDKDLCQEFNISEELWQYIDKFIPDYYDDYKSGF